METKNNDALLIKSKMYELYLCKLFDKIIKHDRTHEHVHNMMSNELILHLDPNSEIFNSICTKTMNIVYMAIYEIPEIMPSRKLDNIKELFSSLLMREIISVDNHETLRLNFPPKVADILINCPSNTRAVSCLKMHMNMILSAYNKKTSKQAKFIL